MYNWKGFSGETMEDGKYNQSLAGEQKIKKYYSSLLTDMLFLSMKMTIVWMLIEVNEARIKWGYFL